MIIATIVGPTSPPICFDLFIVFINGNVRAHRAPGNRTYGPERVLNRGSPICQQLLYSIEK